MDRAQPLVVAAPPQEPARHRPPGGAGLHRDYQERRPLVQKRQESRVGRVPADARGEGLRPGPRLDDGGELIPLGPGDEEPHLGRGRGRDKEGHEKGDGFHVTAAGDAGRTNGQPLRPITFYRRISVSFFTTLSLRLLNERLGLSDRTAARRMEESEPAYALSGRRRRVGAR